MGGGLSGMEEAQLNAPGRPLLAVRDITKRFGALTALDRLSFDVRRDEIFGIAGPNGAGKSTLLNVCAGTLTPDSGQILFDGDRIDGQRPYRLCHKGIGRTFQIPQIFGSLTVRENIQVGASFGRSSEQGDTVADFAVDSLLEMTGLSELQDRPAGRVKLLARKMTMLAAVLATNPRLVFMDEPFAGLNSEEVGIFANLIIKLHDHAGVVFVVVEHKIRALSKLVDRLMIIHFGRCICLDRPEVVVRDPQVVDVYLGTEFDA